MRKAVEQWRVSVHNLYRVAAGLLMGMLVHIVNVLTIMVLAHAIGIKVDFFDWCWITGLMSIAGLVPITIGQVTANVTLVAILQLLGVPLTDAAGIAVLLLSINF